MTHPHDYRPLHRRQGSPYYGSALRVVAEQRIPKHPEGEPSRVESVCDYCREHRWPAVVAGTVGLLFVAFVLAAVAMTVADFLVS